MSLIRNLNRLPIEYITLDATAPLLIVLLGFIQVFLQAILGWDTKIYSFFLGSHQSILPRKSIVKDQKSEKKLQDRDETSCIYKEDAEIVLRSLGLLEAEKFEEIMDSDVVCSWFEKEGIKEEEVNAAFDVFDGNKDGFIDAFELQRVLCALGFKQGEDMENCRRMIELADQNGDGKLDFHEFDTLKFWNRGYRTVNWNSDHELLLFFFYIRWNCYYSNMRQSNPGRL